MNLSQISKLTEDEAREMLERIRWPNGPVCPHCGCVEGHTKFNGKKHRKGVYKCNAGCKEQFTVTVNSVMEASHIPIRTWLMAFAIICSSKKGVSALQLQRQLGLGSYRSAWHMAHRIRHAMSQEPLAGLLRGDVEADETYVGGKPRKVGSHKVGEFRGGRSSIKTPVVVLVERNGRSRAFATTDAKADTLAPILRGNVDPSSRLYTDIKMGREFKGGHERVSHGKGEYARGSAHVNTAESWNALFKRGIVGSFHHISRQHMAKYCNEFSFRWNYRKVTDSERTEAAVKAAEGKRLMYKEPVRKAG
jgi:transposase-like protein